MFITFTSDQLVTVPVKGMLAPDEYLKASSGGFSTDFVLPGDHVAMGGTFHLNPAPVPEPSSLLLLFSGGALLPLLRRLKFLGRIS